MGFICACIDDIDLDVLAGSVVIYVVVVIPGKIMILHLGDENHLIGSKVLSNQGG